MKKLASVLLLILSVLLSLAACEVSPVPEEGTTAMSDVETTQASTESGDEATADSATEAPTETSTETPTDAPAEETTEAPTDGTDDLPPSAEADWCGLWRERFPQARARFWFATTQTAIRVWQISPRLNILTPRSPLKRAPSMGIRTPPPSPSWGFLQ